MKRLLFLFLLVSCVTASAESNPQFSTANFYEVAESGRSVYSMNIAWRFFKGDVGEDPISLDYDDSSWSVVSIPHGLESLPEEASGCINYQGKAWYRKHFTPDSALKGKKLFLHFEAIMGKSKVWLNGELLKTFYGGYLPVIVDVSDKLDWERENVITVLADNSDDPMYPMGKPQAMLGLTYFGGVYRDCWLVAHNHTYITNANYEDEVAGGGLFVYYDKVSKELATVGVKAHIRNESSRSEVVSVEYQLKDKSGEVVASTSARARVGKGVAKHVDETLKVKNPNLWSPDSPYLYDLYVYLKDRKGEVIDGMRQRVGIRSVEFKGVDGLWINGEPFDDKLMGVNRHQEFAVIGNAIPNMLQWRDAKKLRDAGVRTIRSAHYVLDPAFMDACDELGIFVSVATPGWQFWNSEPIFGERVYNDIRNMIRIHRNHASLFYWEPILNETHYPSDFSKNAKAICDKEYPYNFGIAACDQGADGDEYFDLHLRPIMSQLQDDKSYFIREWGDNVDDWSAQNSDSRVHRSWGEMAMIIQADHYANPSCKTTLSSNAPHVLCYNEICNMPRAVSGATLWHSFDHNQGYSADPFLGGIMDAFRQPKYSYYMFKSQRPQEKFDIEAQSGPMIYIAHELTPFSPRDITIYSNCDEVRLTIFKDGKRYTHSRDLNVKGMPSPIVVFEDLFHFMDWKHMARMSRQDDAFLLAEGLIDGKVVVSQKKYPAERPDHIRLRLDDDGKKTIANGSDIVAVIAEVVDKRGTVKRLNNSVIKFLVEGEGRIVGDSKAKIEWGSAPLLIQSTHNAGKVTVKAVLEYEGVRRPYGGELNFETVANNMKEIYSASEVSKIEKNSMINAPVVTFEEKSEQQQEIEMLKRQLNEYKVKEVEAQQTHFGVGIND